MIKSSLLAATAAASVFAALPCSAATPQTPDDGSIPHYALNSEDLRSWHGGVQAAAASRNVENSFTGRASEMDSKRANAYVGYDVFRWATVYALGGVVNVKNTRNPVPGDTTTFWGAGLWLSLLDDDQLDFLSTISRYRLTAGVEFSWGDPADLDWKQIDGFLSFELLNDMYLSDAIFPTQVGVFFGPVFSTLDIDGFEQIDDNEWGFEVGLDFRFADGVFAQGAYSWFNDDSVASFSAGFRF